MSEMAAIANQQFSSLENATHIEMTSMAQQLQILSSELMAARQEDEGATYRIIHIRNSGLTLEDVKECTNHPRIRPRTSMFGTQENVGDGSAHQKKSDLHTSPRRDNGPMFDEDVHTGALVPHGKTLVGGRCQLIDDL